VRAGDYGGLTMPERLFLAVHPAAAVVEELSAYIDPRRDAEPALRWAHPEHWHLTLAFLGAVDDDRADRLVEHLAAVAARTPPFWLELAGVGSFPHPGAARALWLGVGEGGGDLGDLAARCRSAAARVGIAGERRRFQGHLTLARSSRGLDARRWLDVLSTFGPFRWQVTDFVLVDSELTRGGPRHRVSRRFELAGGERMTR